MLFQERLDCFSKWSQGVWHQVYGRKFDFEGKRTDYCCLWDNAKDATKAEDHAFPASGWGCWGVWLGVIAQLQEMLLPINMYLSTSIRQSFPQTRKRSCFPSRDLWSRCGIRTIIPCPMCTTWMKPEFILICPRNRTPIQLGRKPFTCTRLIVKRKDLWSFSWSLQWKINASLELFCLMTCFNLYLTCFISTTGI